MRRWPNARNPHVPGSTFRFLRSVRQGQEALALARHKTSSGRVVFGLGLADDCSLMKNKTFRMVKCAEIDRFSANNGRRQALGML